MRFNALFVVGVAYATIDESRVMLNFDQHCRVDSDKTLVRHFKEVFTRHGRRLAADGSAIDSDIFEGLLAENMDHVLGRLPGGRRLSGEESNSPLGELSHENRQDQILGALHILAAAHIAGPKASELLQAEREGNLSEFLRTLSPDEPSYGILSQLIQSQSLKKIEGVAVVENPVLGRKLLDIAADLPCLQSPPEADILLEPNSVNVVPLDHNLYEMRKREEAKTSKVSSRIPTNWPNFYIDLPQEKQDLDYYLGGPIQGMNGVEAINAWAGLILERKLKEDPTFVSRDEINLDLSSITEAADIQWPKIAIFDVGCKRHPSVDHQFWRNPETRGCTADAFVGTGEDVTNNDCVGYDFGENLADPTLTNFDHGTRTVALAAGETSAATGVIGVCPKCEVVCMKVSKQDGNAVTYSAIFLAIDYVLQHNIPISIHPYGNLMKSEGFDKGAAYKAFKKLNDAGHLAFASGGNNNSEVTGGDVMQIPGGYGVRGLDHLVSVGASSKDGQRYEKSNYGAEISMYAPGEEVLNVFGGVQSGTSSATAVAAGVAGLLKAFRPTLSPIEIKNLMVNTSYRTGPNSPAIISASRALARDSDFPLPIYC